MSRFKFVTFALLTGAVGARADLTDSVRRQNAVVLYEFKETSGDVLYDTSSIGSPLNLKITSLSDVTRGASPPSIGFTKNLIRSEAPAKKLVDACKASGEMTIEVWLENSATSQFLSGFYPNENIAQPLRILSLGPGTGLQNGSNFVLGQFYDGMSKDHYRVAVKTDNSADPVAFLSNAMSSKQGELILPSLEADLDPMAKRTQKVVFTLSKGRVASLYLSDRNGFLYLSSSTTNGFTAAGNSKAATAFSNWTDATYLTLGNEAMSNLANLNVNYQYNLCDRNGIASEPNCASPNRYWRGRLQMVAIYCKAFTKDEIFGASANQVVKYPALDVSTQVNVNENLLKARDIHARLTGIKTPITDPDLDKMAQKIAANDPMGAADLVIEKPQFYSITLRDMAAKMSNRDETINVPLNDFIATFIGAVRDNRSAKDLLTENLVYLADSTKASVPSDWVSDMLKSNSHYEALENGKFDLKAVLVPSQQKVFNGKSAADNPTPAGLLTTRQWIAQHGVAGTNRRLIEYTFREFMCLPMEKIADATGPDSVVGPDIDRFPGGSHSKFTTTCRGCHTIMDGFRPAFSQMTFNNNVFMHALVYPKTNSQANEDNGTGMFLSAAPGAQFVHNKINQNATVFPEGRIVTDDSWQNNAIYGTNASTFAWNRTSGKGIKEFGQLIADSKQFSKCLAQRVFQSVCKREPASSDSALIENAAKEFRDNQGHNIKYLFKKIVTSQECLGGGQ